MPSRRRSAAVWLAAKEWRELAASRAWWVMLVATGPIVGVSFRNAVTTYGDISADPGCGIVCSPLIGIWAPTFSAFEIVAIFLLPFVAIRSCPGDRQSGAMTLELQQPLPDRRPRRHQSGHRDCRLARRLRRGGSSRSDCGRVTAARIAGPELAVVLFGHVLNAALTIAVALAIAAMTDHPSTAAIVTLAITIGTWMVDFAAAVYGGVWERAGGLHAVGVRRGCSSTGSFAPAWCSSRCVVVARGDGLGGDLDPLGRRRARRRARRPCGWRSPRSWRSGRAAFVPGNWDASETRINSFAERTKRRSSASREPIQIEVHLAPQDRAARRSSSADRWPSCGAFMPRTDVSFVARTSTGLYEQADRGYGEIR